MLFGGALCAVATSLRDFTCALCLLFAFAAAAARARAPSLFAFCNARGKNSVGANK